MESIKGESDKAGNNNIAISEISVNGEIPNLPLPRVVESIGRKALYQEGYRFSADGDTEITPEMIGSLYYKKGIAIIEQLAEAGYARRAGD